MTTLLSEPYTSPLSYCQSRSATRRRRTREVKVGDVGIGGHNPIRVQSMTTSDTLDIASTVAESIALAEAGCEIIRITAPNVRAAAALGEIRKKFREAGFSNPIVADIHFLPKAAMEAVEHVEKVRINPGNYADRKKFAVREYTDSQYEEELERLHEAFSPIVKRCKELGRAMRIGTNHGSLSDRIMNRFGDSPEGMVESALEFIRIAESHGFKDIILSMKASNPKVMVAAYRLCAAKLALEGMDYPLHLGVTEAGDGEDGRIKSATGIGALLYDGLGDTIRVSLTEDAIYEIPVAKELAERAMALWKRQEQEALPESVSENISPFNFQRREIQKIKVAEEISCETTSPPLVFAKTAFKAYEREAIQTALAQVALKQKDTPLEGLVITIEPNTEALQQLVDLQKSLTGKIPVLVGEFPSLPKPEIVQDAFSSGSRPTQSPALWLSMPVDLSSADLFNQLAKEIIAAGHGLIVRATGDAIAGGLGEVLQGIPSDKVIVTLSEIAKGRHAVGAYRELVAQLDANALNLPLWIRTPAEFFLSTESQQRVSKMLETSALAGSLFVDGYGDILSFDEEDNLLLAVNRAYNILQGSRARISKTEFVACPSCGRTLFNLQTTTQKIRERTGHLKGVTIAIMGCIVNGPGEMADADFGYVGGAPGKVNLYVGKKCVKFNIPEAEAVERLIDLIAEHGKWVDPENS